MASMVDSHILSSSQEPLTSYLPEACFVELQTTHMICVLSKHDTWALSDPVEKNTKSDLV